MADEKPIIIIKKKGGHGGHHGGAWKVAYADFVTAMMAFFMVMWLVNSAEVSTRQNIAKYFRQPGIFDQGSGAPLMTGKAGILMEGYVPPHDKETKNYAGRGYELKEHEGAVKSEDINKAVPQADVDMPPPDPDKTPADTPPQQIVAPAAVSALDLQRQALAELATVIRGQADISPELKEILGNLEVKLSSDGLVIEIMDTEKASMFAPASARIVPEARKVFERIARMLAKFPNQIDVIGHTDSQPYSSRADGYGNWELSSDRANAARRVLVGVGIDQKRISGVVGRANRELKDTTKPFGRANRRITLKMRFHEDKAVPSEKAPKAVQDFDPTGRSHRRDLHKPAIQRKRSKPTPVNGRLTPEQAVKAAKKKQPVSLPKTEAPTENPMYIEKDKIFSENPVIGPTMPFTEY